MKFILHNAPGHEILAVRAARSALDRKMAVGELTLIKYEDGSMFEVRRNVRSISVWPAGKAT